MAQNKTTANDLSVTAYLESITDEQKRNDCTLLVREFSTLLGLPAQMWGTAIIGFGSVHYKYESGREGDAPLMALSARVNAITVYIGSAFEERESLLAQLGKHKMGKGCLYIKQLKDIDVSLLLKMVALSVAHRQNGAGC